jgi:hypothetical protein
MRTLLIWGVSASAHPGRRRADHRQANKEINSGLADPRIKARLAAIAGMPFQARPSTLASLLPRNRQMEQGNQLVGIKPE